MKTLYFTLCLGISMAMLLPSNLNAQNHCNTVILLATEKYNQQEFAEAVKLLHTCNSSFKSEIAASARLAAKCYLAMHKDTLAFHQAEKLIAANPNYTPSPLEDDADFLKLLKKVDKIPRISFGITTSLNSTSTPYVFNTFQLEKNITKTYAAQKKNKNILGIQVNYGFNKHLLLSSGIMYSDMGYSVQNYVPTDNANEYMLVNYSESLNYMQVPLTIKYAITPLYKIRITPYFGLTSFFLVRSRYSANREFYFNTPPVITNIADYQNIENNNARNSTVFYTNTGISVGWAFKNSILSAEMGYQKALSNLNNPNQRIDNTVLAYQFYYIEDDFALNNKYATITYTTFINYFVQPKNYKP